MGIGPVPAIQQVLNVSNLTLNDIFFVIKVEYFVESYFRNSFSSKFEN